MPKEYFGIAAEFITWLCSVAAGGLLVHFLIMFIGWDFKEWTNATSRILVLDIVGFCIAYICWRMGK